MKTKAVKKQIPYSPYDIKGFEGWLEEMAAQGLIFDRFSLHNDKAIFLPGEPRAIRYRLDPKGKLYNDPARKESYQEMGWKFEDSLGILFYLFSCDDPTAPELHTDPQTLGYAMGQVLRRNLCWTVLPLALFLAVFLSILCVSREARVDLILGRNLLDSFTLLLIPVALAAPLWELRKIYRLKKTLDAGLTPKPGRPHIALPYLLVCLLILVPYCGLRFYEARRANPERFPLEQLELSFDWPDLEALESTGGPENAPLSASTAEGCTRSSLLAPRQEQLYRNTGQDWTAANYASLSVRYIETRTSRMAGQVLEELVDEADRTYGFYAEHGILGLDQESYLGFSQLSHPELDSLSVSRFPKSGQEGFCFAARKGSQVLYVDYTGSGSYEVCLELFLDAWS